jgi:hypothetical protein
MHGKPREQQQQQNGTIPIDSGAAIYCGSLDQYLTEITSPKKGNVKVASGKSLNIEKVGTIYLEDKDTKSIITLQNYHRVPGLTKEMIKMGHNGETLISRPAVLSPGVGQLLVCMSV